MTTKGSARPGGTGAGAVSASTGGHRRYSTNPVSRHLSRLLDELNAATLDADHGRHGSTRLRLAAVAADMRALRLSLREGWA